MTKHEGFSPNLLTTREYWAEYYGLHQEMAATWQAIDDADFRNHPHASLMSVLARFLRGSVIEVGAGDSHLLVDVQKRFQHIRAVGLDYLPLGCDLLRERARLAGASINVVCADLYAPPSELLGAFDLVMSFGLVEHFTDLDGVVAAISRFVKPGGTVFTLIPNIKGSANQVLFKYLTPKVYDACGRYDPTDLALAHERAGLTVESSTYFLSSSFGILSGGFTDQNRRGFAYRSYVWLSRVSKLGWWFERRFFPLPATRWFAPYIVCVARRV